MLGKALTDPVWFFITDWFAIYLVSKGFRLENTLIGFWVPFLAADLGNFAGGGLSSYLIRRGWPVLRARKLVVLLGGIGMTLLIPAIVVSNFAVLIGLFAISTFSYAAWSTMGLTFPADLYPNRTVATVSGMSGAAAGIGTILSTLAIGKITDRYSFEPVLIGASLLPVIATVLVFTLIRPVRHDKTVIFKVIPAACCSGYTCARITAGQVQFGRVSMSRKAHSYIFPIDRGDLSLSLPGRLYEPTSPLPFWVMPATRPARLWPTRKSP